MSNIAVPTFKAGINDSLATVDSYKDNGIKPINSFQDTVKTTASSIGDFTSGASQYVKKNMEIANQGYKVSSNLVDTAKNTSSFVNAKTLDGKVGGVQNVVGRLTRDISPNLGASINRYLGGVKGITMQYGRVTKQVNSYKKHKDMGALTNILKEFDCSSGNGYDKNMVRNVFRGLFDRKIDGGVPGSYCAVVKATSQTDKGVTKIDQYTRDKVAKDNIDYFLKNKDNESYSSIAGYTTPGSLVSKKPDIVKHLNNNYNIDFNNFHNKTQAGKQSMFNELTTTTSALDKNYNKKIITNNTNLIQVAKSVQSNSNNVVAKNMYIISSSQLNKSKQSPFLKPLLKS